ncbi:MAG TPA: hypothetical protein VJ728_15330 [Candidatus Binataceae bacterium]|nr:hypothetical protein [Candidatus Binataceae bacterium]
MFGAVGATEYLAALLHPMTDNTAVAMSASRSHCVNSTFEAVESHRPAILRNLEGLIVFVAAKIAFSHFRIPLGEIGGKETTEKQTVSVTRTI